MESGRYVGSYGLVLISISIKMGLSLSRFLMSGFYSTRKYVSAGSYPKEMRPADN